MMIHTIFLFLLLLPLYFACCDVTLQRMGWRSIFHRHRTHKRQAEKGDGVWLHAHYINRGMWKMCTTRPSSCTFFFFRGTLQYYQIWFMAVILCEINKFRSNLQHTPICKKKMNYVIRLASMQRGHKSIITELDWLDFSTWQHFIGVMASQIGIVVMATFIKIHPLHLLSSTKNDGAFIKRILISVVIKKLAYRETRYSIILIRCE